MSDDTGPVAPDVDEQANAWATGCSEAVRVLIAVAYREGAKWGVRRAAEVVTRKRIGEWLDEVADYDILPAVADEVRQLVPADPAAGREGKP